MNPRRDRPAPRRSSIIGSALHPVPEPAEGTVDEPAPAAEEPAVESRVMESAAAPQEEAPPPGSPAKKQKPPRAQAPLPSKDQGETKRLGVYLSESEFTEAKAAYLYDWTNHRSDCEKFPLWIAETMDSHARKSPAQRKKLVRHGRRAEERRGTSRSFDVPARTFEAMEVARSLDAKADLWLTVSAWAADAIVQAIEEAREANGGDLPTPPGRLPNKLPRRD